jgi:hypothetical protein
MAWFPMFVLSLAATASVFFLLGDSQARAGASAERGMHEAQADFLRAEIGNQLGRLHPPEQVFIRTSTQPTTSDPPGVTSDDDARAKIVAEIKQELQNEMGLLPLQLLRDRRSSFVELYATNNFGETSYGTAGYLGDGYFITVKHGRGVKNENRQRQNRQCTVTQRGRRPQGSWTRVMPMEAHTGDWAIVRTRPLDIPALNIDHAFATISRSRFRLGNDYSKGIIVRPVTWASTSTGLVTCLTDGHPGVSGGGVLDRQGNLVGISIGRIQGDFRFSFILPLRAEMFRKVPHLEHLANPVTTSVPGRKTFHPAHRPSPPFSVRVGELGRP